MECCVSPPIFLAALYCTQSGKFIYVTYLAIMSENDGKNNGKFPLFDDLLDFLGCNLNVCLCDTLLNAIKTYYKVSEITRAATDPQQLILIVLFLSLMRSSSIVM